MDNSRPNVDKKKLRYQPSVHETKSLGMTKNQEMNPTLTSKKTISWLQNKLVTGKVMWKSLFIIMTAICLLKRKNERNLNKITNINAL